MPLNTDQLIAMEQKLKSSINPTIINELVIETGMVERLRTVRPDRLVLALLVSMAVGRVLSLADVLRTFCALTGAKLQYNPFHDQLAKEAFPEFMRRVTCHLMGRSVVRVIKPLPQSALAAFDDVVLHDGSSFAVKATLAKDFPGRFKTISPAAVKLHTIMSLFCDQPTRVALAPDKEAEKHYVAKPESPKQMTGIH
ncbi:MAG: hypothetical protein HUU55_18675 [Myxococcales bacterium]|nr:hypothetical protein [Myxococcales bacterium]